VSYFLPAVYSSALILISPLALAEAPVQEPALVSAFQDPLLQWGPCPAFIPKGCEIAVLHGDPGKDNADVFFKVPANFTIPQHWHTSPERMVLVSGELVVTYDGQQPTTLKPGMYAYGPAKRPHEATCAKGDPCVLFIAFEAPIDAFPTTSPAE
jgi:ketosteroid isomerase-like protein/quercetin dioxygenase-like cupin family protein